MLAYQLEVSSGDPHPTTEVKHEKELLKLTPRSEVHMKILQQLTEGAGTPLADSDDVHLTVNMLYQPIAEQALDNQGHLHTSPIDVDLSSNTFVCFILLLRKMRSEIGIMEDNTTLTNEEFDAALQGLKEIFADKFLSNNDIAHMLHQKEANPELFNRQEKNKLNADVRGAFHAWLRQIIGDKAFAFALLKHGIFVSSDLRKLAEALRRERNNAGGISQSARHVSAPELRSAALKARRAEKDAKKIRSWAEQGWECNQFEQQQLILLNTGQLAQQREHANRAYGYGRGAEKPLTGHEKATLEAFTNQVLNEYMI